MLRNKTEICKYNHSPWEESHKESKKIGVQKWSPVIQRILWLPNFSTPAYSETT